MDIKELYALYLQHPSVKTDTRRIEAGDIFFALKGPNFNGNHFALQALEAGAAYVVVDEEVGAGNDRLIKTGDVLSTLQSLALHHRRQFNIPFIAITGSNGKTTTKELIHQVLSSGFKTYTTVGNLNNHIGVPITILSIRKDAEMAVIEMGANHQREIAGYCAYTLPTHGLITNCGKAHLEGFGGIEGVRKGKGELFDHLRSHNGFAFVNNDDPYIREIGRDIDHVSYGSVDGDITGRAISSKNFLEVEITKGETGRLQTQLIGEYNLPNILAAVSLGKYFSLPFDNIRTAIEGYSPSNSRSQLIHRGTNTIILDAYNANPASMKAAIDNFANMEGSNKILLLGSMMELGGDSQAEHEALVKLIGMHAWKTVVLVGENFRNTDHPYLQFDSSVQARDWLLAHMPANSHWLVKGSRSMQMEKVIEGL